MLEWFAGLSEWERYALMLAVFTIMAVASRGWVGAKPTLGGAKSAAVNIIYLKVTGIVAGLFWVGVVAVQSGYNVLGLPALSREFWDAQPFWLTAVCVLLAYDFVVYWAHRWMHKGVLWPMHAVHHSDRHMHFLTWSRGHPVEQCFTAACLVLATTWMGLGVTDIVGIALIRAFSQYYVHSNIDWNHGPLKYVIVSPRLHRWHHADVPEAYDKNFASIFAFYDVLFGTYYNPRPSSDVPTGVPELPSHDIVKLFTHPFTEWARMARGKFASRRADPFLEPAE